MLFRSHLLYSSSFRFSTSTFSHFMSCPSTSPAPLSSEQGKDRTAVDLNLIIRIRPTHTRAHAHAHTQMQTHTHTHSLERTKQMNAQNQNGNPATAQADFYRWFQKPSHHHTCGGWIHCRYLRINQIVSNKCLLFVRS